jgi:hypothetical protein
MQFISAFRSGHPPNLSTLSGCSIVGAGRDIISSIFAIKGS